MTKTKILLISGIILAIFAILIALFSIQPVEKEIIKIGVIAPLTGTGSYIGEEIKNGVLLAQEEINNKGGINGQLLDVKFEDDQYDPKTTVTVFRNLMYDYEPNAIICAGSTNAIIPLAEQNKIPLLATVSSASKIPEKGEYIFRYFTNADTDAPVIAEYAVNNLNLDSFGILYVNDEFGTSYYNIFKEVVEANKGEIIAAEKITYTDWDYATQLTKIKSKNPDAIYIIGIEGQIVNAIKQMTVLDMDLTILSTGTIATPKGIEEVSTLGLEIYTSAFCLDSMPEDYVTKYMTKYQTYPGFFTTFGYDSIFLISEAIELEGINNIKEGLLSIQNFESTVGEVNSDENGELWFEMCPKKVSEKGVLNLVSGKYYKLD